MFVLQKVFFIMPQTTFPIYMKRPRGSTGNCRPISAVDLAKLMGEGSLISYWRSTIVN